MFYAKITLNDESVEAGSPRFVYLASARQFDLDADVLLGTRVNADGSPFETVVDGKVQRYAASVGRVDITEAVEVRLCLI